MESVIVVWTVLFAASYLVLRLLRPRGASAGGCRCGSCPEQDCAARREEN